MEDKKAYAERIKREVKAVIIDTVLEKKRIKIKHPYSTDYDVIICDYTGETLHG